MVHFQDEIEFKNNQVSGEGALYLLSFGQMRLNQGTQLKFEENIGR